MTNTEKLQLSLYKEASLIDASFEKQALMAGAGHILGRTLGYLARGWGGASKFMGKGLKGIGKGSVARGAESAADKATFAASNAGKNPGLFGSVGKGIGKAWRTVRGKPEAATGVTRKGLRAAPGSFRMGRKFERWGNQLTNWGKGKEDAAKAFGQTIGGTKGELYRGAQAIGPLAAWGFTPGTYAAQRAIFAPAEVPEFLANQQRQGAARAMSTYNDLPMYQRLAAAAMPGMAEGRLQQMDPKMFEYYQKFQQQRV